MAGAVYTTQPLDWERVLETPYFDMGACWNTCGSFCCTNEIDEFRFQLIMRGGANIIYLERELEHLAEAEPELTGDGESKALEWDFGGRRPLRVFQRPCRLRGLCAGCMRKPLHCRLYPFIPEFSPSGELIRLLDASIFDATFDARDWQSPCTVRRTNAETMAELKTDSARLDPLRHPYLMFHFACWGIFLDAYLEAVAANSELSGLEGTDFWRKWEILYFSRKLFDGERMRKRVLALETEYLDLYGEFR